MHEGFWWEDLKKRNRQRWKDNIEMDLQEAWTGLNIPKIMNLWYLKYMGNFLTPCGPLSFSGGTLPYGVKVLEFHPGSNSKMIIKNPSNSNL